MSESKDDRLARTRIYFGLFGTFPPEEDCPAARAELIEANDRCIEGLAFAIGKATRNDDESPIVKATMAPKVGRRIC